jgi:hypothetical protein
MKNIMRQTLRSGPGRCVLFSLRPLLLALRLDRNPPELTIEISAKDLAATLGQPLAPGEPFSALTEQRLAAVDHRLAQALRPLVQLSINHAICQPDIERHPVPSELPLYQRLRLRWHCPDAAEADNWSLDFRWLTDPVAGHVAAGRAVLPDGTPRALWFDGAEQRRAAAVAEALRGGWLPQAAPGGPMVLGGGVLGCLAVAGLAGRWLQARRTRRTRGLHPMHRIERHWSSEQHADGVSVGWGFTVQGRDGRSPV